MRRPFGFHPNEPERCEYENSHEGNSNPFVAMGINLRIRSENDNAMTLEDKVRYGMMAVSSAAFVLSAMGVHVSPLDVGGSYGN